MTKLAKIFTCQNKTNILTELSIHLKSHHLLYAFIGSCFTVYFVIYFFESYLIKHCKIDLFDVMFLTEF